MVPLESPEHPTPATERPMINMMDDVAEPQMTDPTSKMRKKDRYVHWLGETSSFLEIA